MAEWGSLAVIAGVSWRSVRSSTLGVVCPLASIGSGRDFVDLFFFDRFIAFQLARRSIWRKISIFAWHIASRAYSHWTYSHGKHDHVVSTYRNDALLARRCRCRTFAIAFATVHRRLILNTLGQRGANDSIFANCSLFSMHRQSAEVHDSSTLIFCFLCRSEFKLSE